MKKVLCFALLPALVFGIAKYAYAWYVGAHATAYNYPLGDFTLVSGACGVSGLESMYVEAKAHINGVGYSDSDGSQQRPGVGSFNGYALRVGPLGGKGKAYAHAEGKLRHNAGQHDEWLELKSASDDKGINGG